MKRVLASGAVALGLVLLGVVPAGASMSTVMITPAQLLFNTAPTAANQFVAWNQTAGGSGSVGIVAGPLTPPLGPDSLQMSVTGTADHWSVYNYDHIGTPLSSITALGYSTYTDNSTTAPTLQIEINPNSTGVDSTISYSTLNFEPYMNGTVTPNKWQSWNVLTGKVWGSRLTDAPQSAPISWATFLADYPNATVKYGFGVNVGSGWNEMTGNADALIFGTSAGTTVYNFDLGFPGNRPFTSAGSGTETPGTPNCQFEMYCTVTITAGHATSEHLGRGTYSSSLTIYWSLATSNGDGGYCAPASGSGTLTAANGDTLNQTETGAVCEVGATSLTAPHTFIGTFVNTGGTGRFATATGEGAISGGDDGAGNSYYSESGSISY